MATEKETAGETAKKEPKAAAPNAEIPNQECPKIEVMTIAVPKEISDQLQRHRSDIVLLVATIRSLIGMCRDEEEGVKLLSDNSKTIVEMASFIEKLMAYRHKINRLEMLCMAEVISKEIAPIAFKANRKVDDETKETKDDPEKKEVK